MLDYPVTLEPDDNDTILVSFVDLPAHTFGEDREDALRHAVDALATILDAFIKDGREIPAPSKGKIRVQVPALIEAKIRLYEAMRAGKVTKAELGRRLDWHSPQVDRLLAMKHGSQLDQLEAAFDVLGKRLVVGLEDRIPARVRLSARAGTKPERRSAKWAVRHRASSKRG
jgi:antitoxin HicB